MSFVFKVVKAGRLESIMFFKLVFANNLVNYNVKLTPFCFDKCMMLNKDDIILSCQILIFNWFRGSL